MRSIFISLIAGIVVCFFALDVSASYVDLTGEVEGRIKIYAQSCDQDGVFYTHKQLEDGKVTLYDEDDKKVDDDKANSKGKFKFEDVDPGDDYYIKCKADGYVDAKDPSDDKYKSGKFDVDPDKTSVENCLLMKDEELNCEKDVPPIVVLEPECGNAQKTYSIAQSAFDGSFCAVGTIVDTPNFPGNGTRVTWVCRNEDKEVRCSADREKEAVKPPVVKGSPTPVEPEPEPVPVEPEPEPVPMPEEPYHAVAVAGLVSGTAVAFATSAVPLFATMPMAAKDLFIMPFIGLLARRRNEQNWGTVFEEVTKQPIPAVKLVLTDMEGKEVETTYSDQHGRFGFLTTNGTFMINPEKSKYTVNYEHGTDPLYGEMYTGGQLMIEENKVLVTNIAMNAENVDWKEYAQKKTKGYTGAFATFKKWAFILIFYAGFIATAVITFLYPTVINFVLLGAYILLFVYDNFVKQKKYGTVHTGDDKPVPFAVVSLHDKETSAKESFAVTDVIGRYYLLSENGTYDMKIKGQPVAGEAFEKRGEVSVNKGLVREDVLV